MLTPSQDSRLAHLKKCFEITDPHCTLNSALSYVFLRGEGLRTILIFRFFPGTAKKSLCTELNIASRHEKSTYVQWGSEIRPFEIQTF